MSLVKIYVALLCGLVGSMLSTQSEEDNLRVTLQKYIEGTSYNDAEMILEAFYEEADLFYLIKKKNCGSCL